MEKLPPEIIDLIVASLHTPGNPSLPNQTPNKIRIRRSSPIAQYAAVSRKWQAEVERRTFRKLVIRSSELDELAKLLSGSQKLRRRYVRLLRVKILLMPFDDEVRGEHETSEENRQNSLLFTVGIKKVFETVNMWSDSGNAGGIDLAIEPLSESDSFNTKKNEYDFDGWDAGESRGWGSRLKLIKDGSWIAYEYMTTEHTEGELALPSVPTISGLDMSKTTRPYGHSTIAEIAQCLPGLHYLSAFDDQSNFMAHDLRGNRIEFAQSLKLLPASLRVLNMTIRTPDDRIYEHRDPAVRSMCSAESGIDHFSESIRSFSVSLPNLVRLAVKGYPLISTAIFVEDVDSNVPGPTWPNLETYDLTYYRADSFGKWLFHGARRDLPVVTEHDRWSRERYSVPFRDTPDEGRMTDFYRSAARAALGMPKLRRMTLRAADNDTSCHKFQYTSTESPAIARLHWKSSPVHSPAESVLAVWKQKAAQLSIILKEDDTLTNAA